MTAQELATSIQDSIDKKKLLPDAWVQVYIKDYDGECFDIKSLSTGGFVQDELFLNCEEIVWGEGDLS